MTAFRAWLVLAPPLVLLAWGLLPSGWANRNIGLARRTTALGTIAAFVMALAAAVWLTLAGSLDATLATSNWPLRLRWGVYFDSLSAVMLLLISFVGVIIARYSMRYLDGEATQGRFLRWMNFTLGAVLLMVVCSNLILFTLAWMLTSFGLHQLLTHYPDRPWAVWAARKKFLISRLGDGLLVAALLLTYRWCGSLEYRDVFAAAQALRMDFPGGLPLTWLIGALYILAAITKSAQFPFHSWLPDTMETPTPVSALMHAGIINAGGFLILRLSPVVSLSPWGLDLLTVSGAFTALFAGIVMLTQTNIKRSLAYSTIAQMGFMMLQCGIGAFSAALLHIVAHSLYKAHAFLSSGSVLDSAARLKTDEAPEMAPRFTRFAWALALLAGLFICLGTWSLLTTLGASKSGGAVLGFILVLALLQLVGPAMVRGWQWGARGFLAGLLICACYLAGYLLMDSILAHSLSYQTVWRTPLATGLMTLVAAGFVAVFLVQRAATQGVPAPWLQSLYVHAMNGFYVDIPARRLTAWIWRRHTPVP